MRTNTIALQAAAFAAALLSVSAARAETSPLGLWIDHTGRGAVEITQCGDKLCGHVAWLKDAANADACGEQILGDLKPVGGGVWDHGWIYDPDAESKYDVEVTPLGPDKLRVVGYAGTKFLSETMTWRRAPADLPKCSKSSASAPAAKDKPAVVAATPAKPASETKEANAAKPESKTAVEAESKTSDAPEVVETPDNETATNEDDSKPKGRRKNGGEALAKIAEALDVKKIDGGRLCKMDVPYLDMAVTFPCEK
jgi:uncharacterized protein (DUF2147 family)